MTEERIALTWDQVREALKIDADGYVHCFTQPAVSLNSRNTLTLVGAEWPIARVEIEVLAHGAEVAGAAALAMGHGVAVRGLHAPYFYETRPEWTEAQVAQLK